MKVFSKENNISVKDEVLNRISSHTGLSTESVSKLINENLLLSNATSKEYIESLENYFFKDEKTLNYVEYRKVFEEKLNETKNKPESINAVIAMLDKSDVKTDTLSMLTVIKDLLILDNFDQKEKLSNLLSIAPENVDVVKLNENSNFNFDNTQVDYGSLKLILSKNNKRWGLSNDTRSAYEQITAFIDDKIEKSTNVLVDYDANFNKELIKEFASGIISPLNQSYSTNKHMVPNIQALVFDMLIIVHGYIQNHSQNMDMISNKKTVLYNETSNELIKLLYSSLFESAIINKHYIEDVINDNVSLDDSEQPFVSIIDNLSMLNNKVRGNLTLQSIVPILFYMKSASFDFNLKIRPLLKVYINNTLEIVRQLDKIYYKLKFKK